MMIPAATALGLYLCYRPALPFLAALILVASVAVAALTVLVFVAQQLLGEIVRGPTDLEMVRER
ncbi:hypothetical protein LXM94_03090 [Rhizobium sp. TRM95111]|uniref:hypothetical protein n=1 Tax=Rhizobium alarense TaxID=2846851 RepID=UPI001F39972C|nr:hypothetical protein [Rhizobium alarense]MCF3638952.1 hypothetical protein [Rhizobium alarense]